MSLSHRSTGRPSSPRPHFLKPLLGSIAAWLPAGLALLAASGEVQAQTYIWTGANNNNWNQNLNWSPSNPGAGAVDIVVDASTLDLTANRTFNLNNGTSSSDRTVGTIIFGDTNASNTTTYNWTVGANAGSGTPRLILAVSSGHGTIQVNNGTTTFNAAIGGTSGLIKAGGGTLVLANAANTLTGGVFLNGGTLSFVSGSLGANLITNTGNASLTWNGHTDDLSGQIQLGDGFTLTANVSNVPGENTTFATPLQVGPLGSGAFTKGNAGNLTITAANVYTGGTRINNGRLILIGGDNRLSTQGALSFGNTGNSGILQLGDASAPSHQTVTGLTIFGTGTANGVVGAAEANSIFTVNNAGDFTFNGLLGGAGVNENHLELVKSGAGRLTLGGNSTFTGNVTVNGGRLILTNANALGTGAKTISVAGATDAPSVQLNGAAGSLTLGSHLSFVTSNDDALSPAIVSQAGNNVIAGSISPTLGGAGTGNTRILVESGSLALTGNIAPAIATAGALQLILDGAGTGFAQGTIADQGARQLGVIKDGAGVWSLSAANTYTGTTEVRAGRLNLTTAQSGAGAIILADGTTLGVTVAAPGQSLVTAGLTLGAGTTLAFDLGSSSNPSAALIAGGGFSTPLVGQTTLNVAATGLSVGQFPLITYSGVLGGGGSPALVLGSLPARVTAQLAFTASEVRLNVTAFDLPRWIGGVNSIWDLDPDGSGSVGTLNWKEVTSGNPTRYLQGSGGTDSVLFDDTVGVPTNVILGDVLTPATVTVNASSNAFTFSGNGKLSGGTSLIKKGTSTLTLVNTGGNDFTGTVTIQQGGIQIGDGASFGAGQLGSGPIVNQASLVFNRPDDLTVVSSISGSGSIQKQAGGVLSLAGNNTGYDGVITVNAGTLKVGSNTALGSTTGATIVNAGAALEVTGAAIAEPLVINGGVLRNVTGSTAQVSGPLSLTGGAVESLAGNLTVSGVVGGTGGLIKTGAGSVTLSAVNTFSGGLTVDAGTLILTDANTYTGGTTINGGTLQIGATSGQGTSGAPASGAIHLNPTTATATLNILRGDDTLVIANPITSGGTGVNNVTIGLTGAASGSGKVTFTGTNTFTGNVTINGGALRITNSSALGVGPKTVSIASNAGPSLQLDGSAGPIVLDPSISFTASSDGTIANGAANAGAIVNVAGDNVIKGHLALVNGGGGNGRVQVEAGSLTLEGLIDSTGATGGRNLLLGGAGDGLVSGLIANGSFVVNITKDGTGVWTLSNANTFTGTVTINGGILRVGLIDENPANPQPLGTSTGAITLGNATSHGILEYTSNADTILNRALTVNGVSGGTVHQVGTGLLTLAGTVTTNGRPLTLQGGKFDVTGSIAGATAGSSLTVDQAQVLLSNSFNSYNGTTRVIHQGAIQLAVANGLPVTTNLVLGESVSNTAGTVDLHGFDQSVTGLNSSGNGPSVIKNDATGLTSTLTVTSAGIFGGSLRDGLSPLAFSKGGTGVLELTGTNAFTGATSIDGGTLQVTGTLTGTASVTVNSGGTLSGLGVITAGGVLLNDGGILAPGGATAGPLTFALGTGEFNLTSTANSVAALQFELGLVSDQINLTTGTLNLGTGFDLDDFTFTAGPGFGPGSYVLFHTNTPIVGTFGAHTTGSLLGYEVNLGFSGDSGGNQNIVLVVGVPEPTGALLVLSGAGVLLGRRRRSSFPAA